ncbi:hypothetical protein SAMN03159363_0098 [Variovorax sp. EL159]|nr:hypothetical protein SAMN03159363_0098 [Variovorax sp. EL159]
MNALITPRGNADATTDPAERPPFLFAFVSSDAATQAPSDSFHMVL